MKVTKQEIIEVLQKVQQMRAAQKDYFKNRKKAVLIRSKSLERETDEMVNTMSTKLEQFEIDF